MMNEEHNMDRLNTILDLDRAITLIENVRIQLQDMACTWCIDSQVQNLIYRLEEFRVDVLQADLVEKS